MAVGIRAFYRRFTVDLMNGKRLLKYRIAAAAHGIFLPMRNPKRGFT
jgi:hypothetical protein